MIYIFITEPRILCITITGRSRPASVLCISRTLKGASRAIVNTLVVLVTSHLDAEDLSVHQIENYFVNKFIHCESCSRARVILRQKFPELIQ